MKHLILILLLSACTAKTTVSPEFYATSYHTRDHAPSGKRYNQDNPGIGFHATQPISNNWRAGIRAATYKNSFDKQSVYSAATIERCWGQEWHGCAGGMFGAVSGYGAVKPLAAPTIELGYGRVSLVGTVFPTQNRDAAVVAGWVKIKLLEF